MQYTHVIALPVACAGAYFLGHHFSQPVAGRIPGAPQPIAVTEPVDPARETSISSMAASWAKISQGAQTPENQWRALEFFKAWAQRDPLAAVNQLSKQAKSPCALWPKSREPLRQFYLIWASIAPEEAWKQAQDSKDALAVNAVARVLALTAPEKVLAAAKFNQNAESADPFAPLPTEEDSSASDAAGASSPVAISPEVLLLAQRSLPLHELNSVHDSDSRELLIARAVLSQPVDQMLGILQMAGGGLSDALIIRLVDSSWKEVGRYLDAHRADVEGGCGQLAVAYMNAIPVERMEEAFNLQGDSFGFGSGIHVYDGDKMHTAPDFSTMTRRWDTPSLAEAVSKFTPPSSGASANQLACWIACVDELIKRDPSALLPAVAKLPPDFGFSGFRDFEEPWAIPSLGPEQAAAVKAVIDAAPAPLQHRIMGIAWGYLVDFQLTYLVDKLASRDTSEDELGIFENSNVNIDVILAHWLTTAPEAATKFLEQHPKAVDSYEVQRASSNWASADPESASRWLTTLSPSPRKDAAIKGMLESLMWHEPDSCLVWAQELSDAKLRQDSQQKILRNWRKYDPARADAAAASLSH